MKALARIAGAARGLLGQAQTGRPTARSGYMTGGPNSFFWSWRPALRDSRDEVRTAWVPAASRAIDAIHNSGWLAGAVDQVVASTVGPGLRLNARPDVTALGWTPEEGSKWARRVEKRFEAWANSPLECDAAGRDTLGKMTAKAFRSYLATGEAVATLPWIERAVSRTRTKVQQWQSHRLSQTTLGLNLFQGVWMDRNGMPVGYRFRPAMYPGLSPEISVVEIDVPARDRQGRPLVIHAYDGDIGHVRGISPLTPALKVMRQFDQLADATLTAALIQAIFAATVQSDAPTQEVLDALQSKEEQDGKAEAPPGGSFDDLFGARHSWYQNTKIDLGQFGKIAHMFPGDKLEFMRSEHPNGNYEAFAKFLLREVARCLGVTFEDFTGDYTGSSYASINNATSIVWRVVEYRRAHVLVPFVQPIYESWLEEDIDAGLTPFPGGLDGFLQHRAAACQADWRGPPKPQSDLLKTAKAYDTLLGTGTVSRSAVCADQGTSYVDVAHELADEIALRKELGLPEPDAQAADDPLADKLVTEPEEKE